MERLDLISYCYFAAEHKTMQVSRTNHASVEKMGLISIVQEQAACSLKPCELPLDKLLLDGAALM